MSAIHDGPAIDYKELSLDQANDAEFTRLRHSTTSTMKFKLLKSFDNQLIWCDVSTGHNRPYLTAKFRRKVFSNLHGLGHPSHRATKPLINTRFVWHGMNIDIARWCRTCKGCQTAKVSRHNTPVFGKFTEPTERFDHVHVDIVGPLPYADGFRSGLGPKYSVLRYFGTRVPILQYSSVLSTRTFKKYLYSYLYSSTFKNKSAFNEYLRVLYEY